MIVLWAKMWVDYGVTGKGKVFGVDGKDHSGRGQRGGLGSEGRVGMVGVRGEGRLVLRVVLSVEEVGVLGLGVIEERRAIVVRAEGWAGVVGFKAEGRDG